MSELTKLMQDAVTSRHYDFQTTKRIQLANGVTLSVQASGAHYCSPRMILPYNEYSEFEVGFPSVKIEALMPYCEYHARPTETVYAYVPRRVLDYIIHEAGGVAGYAEVQSV